MAKKKGVSLNTSDFQGDIRHSVLTETPPKMTSEELHRLDFHTTGAQVVRDVLRREPIPRISYRELSRHATHEALLAMTNCGMLSQLRFDRQEYYKLTLDLPQPIRILLDSCLAGAAGGYKPYVSEKYVHLWFWSAEEKDAMLSMLSEADLPFSMVHVFVAGTLMELDNIGTLAGDLKREYDMGIQYLALYQAVQGDITGLARSDLYQRYKSELQLQL